MQLSVRRLKRTRPAQFVKRVVLRRGGRMLPRLSVVVPFHNAVGQLEACVESLIAQSHPNVEIVLVDDGSVDGSADVARRYARSYLRVRLVSQPHLGVGAARNAGAARARGKYLAFCDADDTVVVQGYERLAGTLHKSGSDVCVGSVALQHQGRYDEPLWARRSNRHRRLGITLDEHPEIMANLMPGTRVFRRSFWDEQQLAFETEGDHSDIVTVVDAMLQAKRIDIIPAVVYRWRWRADGRSLLQQGLQDHRRVADRIARLCQAGELVVASAGESVQRAYFAEILHTTVPDLVRGGGHPGRRVLAVARQGAEAAPRHGLPRDVPGGAGGGPGHRLAVRAGRSGRLPRTSWSTRSTTSPAIHTGWSRTTRTSRFPSSTRWRAPRRS